MGIKTLIERGVTPWQKARYEFKYEVVKICEADASFLLEKDSTVYKRFEQFCLRKLIFCRELSVAEGFTFIVFVKFESIKEAKRNYYDFVRRDIKEAVLQKKARTVRNKLLKCFASIPGLKEDVKRILDNG